MRRREFFGVAAALPAFAAVPIDVRSIKSRGTKKVDIAYKSPHAAPNGLQQTAQGLWVVDDRTVDGKNHVSLINYADGKVIREFQVPGLSAPSGMTVDNKDTLWINSTHSGLIFNCNSQDGTILAKYTSPGIGAIYRLKGDPPAARSPLTPAYPAPENTGGRAGRGGRGAGLPPGQVPAHRNQCFSRRRRPGHGVPRRAAVHSGPTYSPRVCSRSEDLGSPNDVATGR